MRHPLSRTPGLDFVVLGAQKAGTTSLWRYLEDNEALRMPPSKESPLFTEPAYPDDLGPYMRALFKSSPRGARLGTVTPAYMLGANGVDPAEVARRIKRTFPAIRLIALLRDPVERAASAHLMSLQRHGETRSFDVAITELLDTRALEEARRDPTPMNTYVVGGEYGRILEAYLDVFDREQLLVELTNDLERRPGDVVARVCEHVGAEPHVPARLGERFNSGGAPRVSAEAEEDLKDYLRRHVWPRVRHAEQHREAFEFWFRLWNADPASTRDPLDPGVSTALRKHFADDTVRLERALGIRVPWRDGASVSPADGAAG